MSAKQLRNTPNRYLLNFFVTVDALVIHFTVYIFYITTQKETVENLFYAKQQRTQEVAPV